MTFITHRPRRSRNRRMLAAATAALLGIGASVVLAAPVSAASSAAPAGTSVSLQLAPPWLVLDFEADKKKPTPPPPPLPSPVPSHVKSPIPSPTPSKPPVMVPLPPVVKPAPRPAPAPAPLPAPVPTKSPTTAAAEAATTAAPAPTASETPWPTYVSTETPAEFVPASAQGNATAANGKAELSVPAASSNGFGLMTWMVMLLGVTVLAGLGVGIYAMTRTRGQHRG